MVIVIILLSILCLAELMIILSKRSLGKMFGAFIRQWKYRGICKAIAFSFCYIKGNCIKKKKSTLLETARDSGMLRVAFYVSGGLGDYIVSAKVLEEIQEYAPDSQIDVFADKTDFEKAIYGSRNNVTLKEGFLYQEECYDYDVAVDVGHFVKVDSFSERIVNKYAPELSRRIKYIVDNWNDLYIDIPEQWWRERVRFETCRQLHLDRWTELRMGKAFKIENKKVYIPMLKEFEEVWRGRGYEEKRYITLNFGSDKMVPGKKQQLKLWKRANYEQLISLVKAIEPNVHFIQLGASDAEKILGCDDYILGESIELTKWVLKHSMCHIDCEGGLVHLASQLGTKCIVIFGPTPIHMYAYENNVNLVSPVCNNCMGLHKDWAYECYCGEAGACMNRITPDAVFYEVKRIVHFNEE